MNHPYRDGQPVFKSTLELETNDVFVEVAYLDRAGMFAKKKREFISKPTAWYYSNTTSKEIRTSHDTGKSHYKDWKNNIGTQQFVTFDDLLIPMSRVLDIVVEVKERTAVVDIERKEI